MDESIIKSFMVLAVFGGAIPYLVPKCPDRKWVSRDFHFLLMTIANPFQNRSLVPDVGNILVLVIVSNNSFLPGRQQINQSHYHQLDLLLYGTNESSNRAENWEENHSDNGPRVERAQTRKLKKFFAEIFKRARKQSSRNS